MNCNFAQNLFCASMVHSRKRKLGVIFFIQRLPRHPYEGIGSLGSLGVSNHELEYSPNHRSVHLWNFVFSNVVFPFWNKLFHPDIEEKKRLTLTWFLEKMWWMGECQKIFNEPQNLKRHLFILQKMHNIIVRPTRLPTLLRLFSSSSSSPLSCIHHLL